MPTKRDSRERVAATAAGAEVDETETRVRHVMTQMAEGTWRTGTSHARCAKEWCVSESTVNRLAAEAGRRLRALAGEHEDEIRGRLLAEVERIGELALAATYVNGEGLERPKPDYRAALQAIDLRAKLLGLVTNQVQVKTDFSRMSDDDLEREALKAARAVLEKHGEAH